MGIRKKTIGLLLVLIASVLTITPLFNRGFFPMHDDTQPTRVYEMAKALSDGQFPVRWVEDLGYGYGYPLYNFYAPLPYYVGSFFTFFGFNAIDSSKIMFALGMIGAGISMYFFSASLWGVSAGIIAALLYVFLPYHGVQLYVRGAVGELFAYAMLPLVMWAITRLDQKIQSVFLGGIGLALIVLSHNISALIVLWILFTTGGLLTLSVLLQRQNPTKIFTFVSIVLFGLGLSAFFWVPAIQEAHLTKVEKLTEGSNNFQLHFVFPDQLWDSPWGFAGSTVGRQDGMSFKVGKLHLLLALSAFIFTLFKNKSKNKLIVSLLFFSLLLCLFMMTDYSLFIWDLLPKSSFIQYPWRLLMFAGFFAAVTAASIALVFHNKAVRIGTIGMICLLIVIFNAKYFAIQYPLDKTEADYISQEKMQWDISKISDEYLPKNFPIPEDIRLLPQTTLSVSSDIIVQSEEIESHRRKYQLRATTDSLATLQLAYFPGWRIFLDTKELPPTIKNGLLEVALPKGDHVLTVVLTNTIWRELGNAVSLISLFIAIFLYKKQIALKA